MRPILSLLLLTVATQAFGHELPPDLDRIHKAGKLVVAMVRQDRPPFFMKSRNGELTGLDVELAKDIAAKLGVKIEFLRTAEYFDDLIDQVDTRKASLAISRLSVTPERALRVSFSSIYLTLPQVVLVSRLQQAKNKKGLNSTEFLDDPKQTVGHLKNSAYAYFSKRTFPNAGHKAYDDYRSMYQDIAKGVLQACLHEDVTASTWLNENPSAAIRIHKIQLADQVDPSSIAVHWKDADLLQWLNTYLEVSKLDGSLSRLTKKYINTDGQRKN